MNNKVISVFAIVFSLNFPLFSFAGPYEDAKEALKVKNYDQAKVLFKEEFLKGNIQAGFELVKMKSFNQIPADFFDHSLVHQFQNPNHLKAVLHSDS